MKFRQKITLSLLLTFVLGGVAFAQVVDIPERNAGAISKSRFPVGA